MSALPKDSMLRYAAFTDGYGIVHAVKLCHSYYRRKPAQNVDSSFQKQMWVSGMKTK